ncbi:MAG: transglutaminase TgpA family protein [Thermoleophilia bacterium]
MFERFINIYSRINPKRVPENSLGLRLSVLAAILTAEVAILSMGYYDALSVLGVPAFTIAGFAYSWKYRQRRNLLMKFVLSILVITVAVLFTRELTTNIYDTRLPLIKLLLWLQVLHSFDLPARRDLKFSLASGLTLLAAAAVLSTGMVYILGLALFTITAVIALIFLYISEASQQADRVLEARPVQVIAYGAFAWLAGIAIAVPLLLIMPQSSQARLHALPVSNLQKILGDFTAGVVNPSYSSGGNPFDHPPQFSPDSYYGFNPYMDLRSRGNLSDDVVLKVRSDDYDFYRGVVFDRYNGKGWEISSEATAEITTDSPPFTLSNSEFPLAPVKSKLQSFYLQTEMPNIIFAAWKPQQLFFPASKIKVDDYGSIRSPFPLTEDTVYSVISEEPIFSASTLRHYPRASDPPAGFQYTSLPESDDLEEVARLSLEITAPYNNRYDKVQAIEKYLKENYTYDLDIPPLMENKDAVAYFLFDEKRGYCEHFASAMAVMARSAGIPARVVTGYSGGSYNPFTALWEIKQSDAHAWVEVYFGVAGWAPFDPTPGFEVPAGQSQGQSPWIAGKIFTYLEDVLGGSAVGGVLATAGGAIKGVLAFALALPLGLTTGIVLGMIALVWIGRKASRPLLMERRRRRLLIKSLGPDYSTEQVLRDYLKLAIRLQQRGLVRRPDETIREFARRVSDFLDSREFVELSAMVERLRYQEAGLPEPSGSQARQLAEKVTFKLKNKEPGAWRFTGLF